MPSVENAGVTWSICLPEFREQPSIENVEVTWLYCLVSRTRDMMGISGIPINGLNMLQDCGADLTSFIKTSFIIFIALNT